MLLSKEVNAKLWRQLVSLSFSFCLGKERRGLGGEANRVEGLMGFAFAMLKGSNVVKEQV